jgi:predicted phosphodiesterase
MSGRGRRRPPQFAAPSARKRSASTSPPAVAVVFGHSHLPLLEREGDGTFQIFNPGSPTERRGAPGHTMGVAALGRTGELRFRHLVL